MPVSFRTFLAQFIVGGDDLNVQIERPRIRALH